MLKRRHEWVGGTLLLPPTSVMRVPRKTQRWRRLAATNDRPAITTIPANTPSPAASVPVDAKFGVSDGATEGVGAGVEGVSEGVGAGVEGVSEGGAASAW